MKKINAGITGVHAWFPPKKITNKDLEKMVDTNNEWIVTRTGIKERRILDKGLATSDLAVNAIKGLLKKKNIDAKEIDLIICATATPDMLFPSTSCIIADKIKAIKLGAPIEGINAIIDIVKDKREGSDPFKNLG